MRRIYAHELGRSVAVTLLLVVAMITALWSVDLVRSDTVTVSATVTNTVSCSADNSSTAFGTLSASFISTSTPSINTTLSCNSGGGCTLNVSDAGNTSSAGLYAAAATSSPIILSTTATLAAGTEGYGIQASTTAGGSGATLSLNSIYNKATSTTQVGGLSLTNVVLASSSAPVSGRVVNVNHLAAISGVTKAGVYSDTITYSCTGN